MKKRCKKPCPEYKECKDTVTSWLFFVTAIIATIAMRVIGPLDLLDPIYGKVAWYIGVTGFFIFFLYKFIIDHKRSQLIKKQNLIQKVRQNKRFDKEDYSLMNAIMCGLISNKDKINFFFISAFSIIALVIALYFDFIR